MQVDPPPLVNTDTELFMVQEVEMGIKNGCWKSKRLSRTPSRISKVGLKDSCTSHYKNLQQHHTTRAPHRLEN